MSAKELLWHEYCALYPNRCYWCDKPYNGKGVKHPILKSGTFCGKSCIKDRDENSYPMPPRMTDPAPASGFYMSQGYLCMSAPNKYRQMDRKRGFHEKVKASIIEQQKKDFPWLSNPAGAHLGYPWMGDLALLWEGATLAEANAGLPQKESA